MDDEAQSARNNRLQVIVKAVASSSTWLRKEAQRFGQSLQAAVHMSRNKILDGYILRANRTGARVVVRILDTPALIALPGDLLRGTLDTPEHCALYTASLGRDFFTLALTEAPDVVDDVPSHPGTVGQNQVTIGAVFTPAAISSNVRYTAATFKGWGVVRVDTDAYMHHVYSVNPYAFMNRDDRIVYTLTVYSPTFGSGIYDALVDGWVAEDPISIASVVPWSLRITDDLIRQNGDCLPFSLREDPPDYDDPAHPPTEGQFTTYNNIQMPWAKTLNLGTTAATPGVERFYETLVPIHVVLDMKDDNDVNGAKGLWFGQFRVQDAPPPTVEPVPTLLWYDIVDSRDSTDPVMRPFHYVNSDVDPPVEAWGTNNYFPAMLVQFVTGEKLAVTLHQNYQKDPVDDPDPLNPAKPYLAIEAFWMTTSVIRYETPLGPTIGQDIDPFVGVPHDASLPIGMDIDTEGQNAYAVFFSSDVQRNAAGEVPATTSIDVLHFTAAGATLAFSGFIPQRYCQFVSNARYECVRYIGNNKFMFPATDQYTETPGLLDMKGDLVAMIYDATANTVTMAGTVDATIRYGFNLKIIMGSLDCPVMELADDAGVVIRKATVIMTMGGKAQLTGEPGGEAGTTYISYDSGATWFKIADYGSAAGARYCGTMLITRTQEL